MIKRGKDWDGEDAIMLGLTAAAVVPLLLFTSFVVRASAKLGHRPVYDMPDPKDLGFGLHHAFVWGGGALLLLSVVAMPVFTLIQIIRGRLRLRHLGFFCIWTSSILLYVVTYRVFGEWFSD